MSARLLQRQSKSQPGGALSYVVWVWSTVPAKQITASAHVSGHAVLAPKFTLCPTRHTKVCPIGSLPANQAFELLITVQIGAKATVGEQVTLTVNVQGAALSPAEAAITALVSETSPSPNPTTSLPTLPPVTLPPLPGSTVTPGNLSGLFPVVTPSPLPTPSPGRRDHRGTDAIPTASTLPFDPRLIGGQLAGLAVLAAAITMVVARLSLRTPQTPTGPTVAAPAEPAGEGESSA